MTLAQASIRQLFEQVRVLEAETARRASRHPRRPHALVLIAAAAIGAVSAGTLHSSAHREPARAIVPIVHLIDAPAERARAVAVPAPKRTHVIRHATTPVVPHVTPRSAVLAPTAVHPVAPPHPSVPASVAPTHAVPARPPVDSHAVQHQAAPLPAPVHRAVPKPTPPHPNPKPQPAADPVGIGPVAVATSEEPVPDPGGATPTTTTP